MLYRMWLAALSLCFLGSAAANAALTSLYTFDDHLDNAVAGAADGLPVGTAPLTYVSGMIGNAVSFDGIDQAVNPTNDVRPKLDDLWAGTVSVWLKTDSTSGEKSFLHIRELNATGSTLVYFQTALYSGKRAWRVGIRTHEGGVHWVLRTTTDSNYSDNQWHQVTWTWDMRNGSGAIYYDGESLACYIPAAYTGTNTFTPFEVTSIGADNYMDGTRRGFFAGAMDDVSAWDEVLTAGKAGALFNLATTGLNYNALDAATLFDVASSGLAAQTSDNKTWYKIAGLTGEAGSVTQSGADWTVQLDGGFGVTTVPEPGALSLLIAGLLGLVGFRLGKVRC